MKLRKRFVAGVLAVLVVIVGMPYPGGSVKAEELPLELEAVSKSSVAQEANANNLFCACDKLTELDFSNFDTS